MVLADLGRKITSALKSLSNATIINEEVSITWSFYELILINLMFFLNIPYFYASLDIIKGVFFI